jgi:hypothetical protein
MTQLTNEQIDELRREVITDPIHECSIYGSWYQDQVNERGSDDCTQMKISMELEDRRLYALVNLALRRYCKP